MATILVLNAVSSLLAGCAAIGVVVRRNRRARSQALLQRVYVTAESTRARPGD